MHNQSDSLTCRLTFLIFPLQLKLPNPELLLLPHAICHRDAAPIITVVFKLEFHVIYILFQNCVVKYRNSSYFCSFLSFDILQNVSKLFFLFSSSSIFQ